MTWSRWRSSELCGATRWPPPAKRSVPSASQSAYCRCVRRLHRGLLHQLAELRSTERAHRELADDVRAAIDLVPLDAHPMDEVRTAVGVIGAQSPASFSAAGVAYRSLPASEHTGQPQ